MGGLHIIGTERHESRRIDNQLRGRSGRQGDPGESTFFISLEDDIMRLFGDERMKRFSAMSANLLKGTDGDLSQNTRILSDVMEKAQKRVESENFKRRKSVLEYDDILNEQRKQIYAQRNEILMEGDVSDKIKNMIVSTIAETVEEATTAANEQHLSWDLDSLYRKYGGWGCTEGDFDFALEDETDENSDKIGDIITEKALALYESRKQQAGEDLFRRFERAILLGSIDELWLDHIEGMENLERNVMLQSYAHRDPLTEYKITGSNMYADLIDEIRQKTVREVLTRKLPETIVISPSDLKNLRLGRAPEGAVRRSAAAPAATSAAMKAEKVGPNSPCPCGSGKKYKKCCGAGKNTEE